MNIFDVKHAQTAAICAALVVVKPVPAIMSVSIWWFAALMIISANRPLIVVYGNGRQDRQTVVHGSWTLERSN